MKKIRFFHLPVFMVALFGLILSVVLYMFFPGNSLAEYALTLEDGQFICENGYIYETIEVYDSGTVVANRLKHSLCRFTILFGTKPAVKLLPHEYAMQITDYKTIFMDNQGTVWLHDRLNYTPLQVKLEQFFIPSAELDAAAVGKLQIDNSAKKIEQDNVLYHPTHSSINEFSLTIPFKAELTSEISTYRDYSKNTSVEFSVKLKDGWHSIDVYRPYTQYSIEPKQYNQLIKLLRLGSNVYMNTQCRLTVYDKNSNSALSQVEFVLTIKDGKAYIEVAE